MMKASRTMLLAMTAILSLQVPASAQQTLKIWPVGPEFQVNDYTTYYQNRASVAVEPDGDFLVVWQHLESPFIFSGIKGRRFASNGEAVGTEFQVNSFTTSYAGQRPAVASDASGGFVVVWDDYYNGDYSIYGRTYDSAGNPIAPEFIINSDLGTYQYNAAVAKQSSGEFVVVWNTGLLGSSPYQQYAYARRYDSAGTALGTEFAVNTSGDYYGDEPDVGIAASGDYVVVWNGWFQDNDDFSGVFARQHASSGAPLSADFHVNTYTTNNQYGSVAVEQDGDFLVIWRSEDEDGDNYGVYAQRYNSTGTLSGTEFRVNTVTTGSQEQPAVAVDAKGNFVVVWNSYDGQDGDLDGVFARAFNSLGAPLAHGTNAAPLGTEFQVNTYTTDRQQRPAVAAAGNGDFVVVWDSYYNQDGSYEGIFGQRLAIAYEVQNQAVGAGGSASTELGGSVSPADPPGATSSDPIETQVISPNPGTVTILERASSVTPPSGYSFIGQQVSISAPAASVGAPLRIVFQIDTSLRPGDPAKVRLLRNGVCVPNCLGSVTSCTGGPTIVNPSACTPTTCSPCETTACVSNRCVLTSGDVQLTVLTAAASDWNLALPGCPATPDPGCITGFGKGLLAVKESVPGKEHLIAKLLDGPGLAQTSWGNPLDPGGTVYNLCVYDDTGALAGSARVNRAGDTTCSGGSSACWKPLGGGPPDGVGYAYKDTERLDDGTQKLQLKSVSGAKILFKAKAPAPPFPLGIPAALASTSTVTVQLHADDAPAPSCFSITLADIKKQEPNAFKAK